MPKKLSEQEHELHRTLVWDARKRGTVLVATKYGKTIHKQDYNIPTTRYTLMAIEAQVRNTPLRRVAYVCDGGQVRHTHDLGFGSITDAFISRPSGCKYCVFEKFDGTSLLVDMFQLTQTGNTLELDAKEGTTHDFNSVDAAIMYALTIE